MKTMKRMLAMVLVLVMTVALAPATNAEDRAEIVMDFSNTTISEGTTQANVWHVTKDDISLISTPGYTVYKEESYPSNWKILSCAHVDSLQNPGKFLQVHNGEKSRVWPMAWMAGSGNYQFAISFTVPEGGAGYYVPNLSGLTINTGTDQAVYVDDTFVGNYNFYNADSPAKSIYKSGAEKPLNAVYLSEGTHSVFMRNVTPSDVPSGTSSSYVYLKKMRFVPISAAPAFSKISTNLPDTIMVEKTVDFTIGVDMSDGTKKFFGFAGNAGADAKNNISYKIKSGNDILADAGNGEIVASYDEGIKGTITATEPGQTTIEITAVVDGKTHTEEKTINVIENNSKPVSAELRVSKTLEPTVTIQMSDGTSVDGTKAEIVYTSSDESIIEVDNVNKRLIAKQKAGEVTITANIIYKGHTVQATYKMTLDETGSIAFSGVKVDYLFYKKDASWSGNMDVSGITYDYTGGNYAWYGSTVTTANPAICYAIDGWNGRIRMHRPAGGWTGFKIYVPKEGKYLVNADYLKYGRDEGVSEVYIIPANTPVNNAADEMNTDTYVGDINTLDESVGEILTPASSTIGEVIIPEKGEYAILFKAKTASYTTIHSITLDGGGEYIPVSAELRVSKTLKPTVTVQMSDRTTVDGTETEIVYTSSDESLIEVDNVNKRLIGKQKAGEVTITADITYKGYTVQATYKMTLDGTESLPFADKKYEYKFYRMDPAWTETLPQDMKGSASNIGYVGNITYEYTDDNYAWYGSSSTASSAAWCYASEEAPTGRLRIHHSSGGWTAFKIKVPTRGKYAIKLDYIKYFRDEGISDVYIFPASVPLSEASDNMNDDTCVGMVNTLDTTVTEGTLDSSWIGEVNIQEAGEYVVAFKIRNSCYTTIRSLTLDGVEGMKRVELRGENKELDVGKNMSTEVFAYLLDGSRINNEDIKVEYKTKQKHIATVSETGKITGVSEGTAEIVATVSYEGVNAQASFIVNVTDNTGIKELELRLDAAQIYKGSKIKLVVSAHMNSGNTYIVPTENVEFMLSSEPDGIASVSEGYITATNEGKVSINAKALFKGEEKETNELSLEIVPGTNKTEPTIYTYEMRANALENAGKYKWAKTLQKSSMEEADAFVENLDAIYNLIIGEGLPRSVTAALQDDPQAFTCVYCGLDIREKYGLYSWRINTLARPWKIQCPDCKRLFPSNDFGSFYKLGVVPGGYYDEQDKTTKYFDFVRALEAHREMLINKGISLPDCTISEERRKEIAQSQGLRLTDEERAYFGYGVKGGYLCNDLYNDVGKNLGVAADKVSTWGVDDGWGWDTGENTSTGLPIKKAFIAYYNFATWSTTGNDAPYRISNVIDTLRDAYLYTGDIKYGRAGAILIDRVADVYPSYKWDIHCEYQHSHGGRCTGKIEGNLWERLTAQGFAQAYDAFWPAMDDPEVIKYLSEKAEEFGLENKKLTADMIRKNCDDGICREIFKAVKEGRILSNYPLHHNTLAHAAVALDSMPDTQEMFDWMREPSVVTSKTEVVAGKKIWITDSNSGGQLMLGYIDTVDRDGFGDQVSELYNQQRVNYSIELAEVIGTYEKLKGYDVGIDFWESPRFRKMFYATFNMTMAGNYTLQLGDQYSTASTQNTTRQLNLLYGMERFEDMTFAQQYYAVRNGDVANAYISIFEKNAGELGKKIEDYVKEHGEIKLGSQNLAGYGLAVLRGGEKVESTSGAGGIDNRRDTWMWYGSTLPAHAHRDVLQMGIDAYGFNFTPDLGYPEATGTDPNRVQWVNATISHNTVLVNNEGQNAANVGTPLHFDDAGMVGIIDVETPDVYDVTDIYRRTLVTVKASESDAYTLDFFRVRGGNEHTYSFHTQSFNGVSVDGLSLIAQNGGTYAGEDTQYGADPNTKLSGSYETKYPRGYTWLRNVRRDNAPQNSNFSVNFKQTDFNNQVSNDSGLNLKWIALNDWVPSSVGFATAETPRIYQNANIPELDYMLVHRKGNNLDTLFTSVIEPYNGAEYIKSTRSVALTSDGTETADDVAKAVKVELASGRCDYIIYATNNKVTYTLTDGDVSFGFRGFVGVYSVNESGANIYSYINDGEFIGNLNSNADIKGKVLDFTKKLANENSITVEMEERVDPSTLAGRYIYIDNKSDINGAYKILGATEDGDNVILDVGDVTLIKEYKDKNNVDNGYIYVISENDDFSIPLSVENDSSPIIEAVSKELTTSAGSSLSVKVNATSPVGEKITYMGSHLPRGASINSDTGVVTWKPTASQVGTNGFLVTVRDALGREASIYFDVTVYGATTGSDSSENGSGSEAGGGGGGAVPSEPETPDNPTEPSKPDNSDVPPVSDNDFIDLGNHAWAKNAINSLADEGIIRGTTANTFSPASNITRADFAILLVRAFKLSSDNAENFDDVNANDYFASELATARNTGIINGIGENKYAPRNTITRQDMMVMVYRALQNLNVEFGVYDEPQYPDFATVAPYAKDSVSALIGAGLINGKNGNIAPLDYTTRAEVAVLI